MGEDSNWFKETLDWLHHAYWIREFLVSTGVWTWATKWAVQNAYIAPAYQWPITALLVGISMYLLTLVRHLWPKKKTSASNRQNAAALVINPTETGLPADVDIKEFFRLAYRTPLEAEVRKNFYLLARQEQPKDIEKFYLEFIGIGFVAVAYDNIWWPMYGSQLAALIEVNRNAGLVPLSKVKGFFDQAEREFQKEYKRDGITFDAWLSYLTRNLLVIRHRSDMVEITVKGKDYLKYLTHFGRGLATKRL